MLSDDHFTEFDRYIGKARPMYQKLAQQKKAGPNSLNGRVKPYPCEKEHMYSVMRAVRGKGIPVPEGLKVHKNFYKMLDKVNNKRDCMSFLSKGNGHTPMVCKTLGDIVTTHYKAREGQQQRGGGSKGDSKLTSLDESQIKRARKQVPDSKTKKELEESTSQDQYSDDSSYHDSSSDSEEDELTGRTPPGGWNQGTPSSEDEGDQE